MKEREDSISAITEEENTGGWIVTYADLVTLLMVYFVLLFSQKLFGAAVSWTRGIPVVCCHSATCADSPHPTMCRGCHTSCASKPVQLTSKLNNSHLCLTHPEGGVPKHRKSA